MSNLAAAVAYAGFVLLALWVIAGSRHERTARRRASYFIAFTLAASFTAGLTQRDFWPFTSWRLMQRTAPATVSDTGYTLMRAMAVTSDGHEYLVDYRALEPFTYEEVLTWLMRDFPRVRGAARDSVGAFLLQHVEAARLRTRAGRWPGVVTAPLGVLAAPSHLLFARAWRRPGDVPDTPFVTIRLYWERWNVEERARRPDAITLIMAYEYPARS